MSLVVKGRLNKQIAADIGLSEITVKVRPKAPPPDRARRRRNESLATIIAVGSIMMAIEVWLPLAMPSLRALEADKAVRSVANISVSSPR